MDKLLKKLAPLTAEINQCIENLIAQDEELVGQVARYNFTGGGKRIRPLMFCLASQALKQPLTLHLIEFSTSFEFLHMATLLHDDIVDLAETRRGRQAAHLVFGVPETVLAGDYLLSKAATLGVNQDNIQCAKIMAAIVGTLSLGELVQLKSRRQVDLPESEYFKIIYRKTAVLMEGAAQTAGILAKAPDPVVEALKLYGQKVGLAFQIMDDILDYKSDSETFGKPVGHDLDEGKITLPFILARQNLNGPQAERLCALAAQSSISPESIQEITNLVSLGRGVQEAEKKAAALAQEAIEALADLPGDEAVRQLKALALYTVERNY